MEIDVSNKESMSAEFIEEVAKALAYMDIECMDMGDSHLEQAEFLCEQAGIEFDDECSIENEYYYEEKSVEAYKKMLKDGSINSMIESIVEENYDNLYYIRQVMVYSEIHSTDIMEHPTVKAISSINEYIQNIKDESVCSVEHCKKMTEVMENLSAMDIELCYIGNRLGNKFFRYLNPDSYFISNTAFTVGRVLNEEDTEYKLGEYTSHASVLSHLKNKDNSRGYTIAFTRKEEGIVSHIDTGCELTVDKADLEQFAKDLANKINELTENDFINTKNQQQNECVVRRRGR